MISTKFKNTYKCLISQAHNGEIRILNITWNDEGKLVNWFLN